MSETATPTQRDVERREFASYCRFFTIRAIQSIVQSRLGKHIVSQSRVRSSNADWFNVNVEEQPEIQGEIKRSLNGRWPPNASSICVYISLQTADGQHLHLECWNISFSADVFDANVSIKAQAYHRFGTLLRSVISVSRVVPAYRNFARRQSRDTFVLCYQIVEGAPQLQLLGNERKSTKLGAIVCPFGTLDVSLTYRTQMVISAGGTGSVEASIKEDYFVEPLPPKPRRSDSETLRLETLTIDPDSRNFTALSNPRPLYAFGARGDAPQQQSPVSPGYNTRLAKPPSVPLMFAMGDASGGENPGSSRESLCSTTFSTSPPSEEFPLPSPFRRVSFQFGTPPATRFGGGDVGALGMSPPYGAGDSPSQSHYLTYPHPSYHGLVQQQQRASLGNIPTLYRPPYQVYENLPQTILSMRRRTTSDTIWSSPGSDAEQHATATTPQAPEGAGIASSGFAVPSSGAMVARSSSGAIPKQIHPGAHAGGINFYLGGQTPPSAGSSPKVSGSYPYASPHPSVMISSQGQPHGGAHVVRAGVQFYSPQGAASVRGRGGRFSAPGLGHFDAGAKYGSLDLLSLPFADLLRMSSSFSAPCLALDTIKEVADRRGGNGGSSSNGGSSDDAAGNEPPFQPSSAPQPGAVLTSSMSANRLQAASTKIKKQRRLGSSASASNVGDGKLLTTAPTLIAAGETAGSSSSSDSDGFVHVPAFTGRNYAAELGEFVKAFKDAPPVLESFSSSSVPLLVAAQMADAAGMAEATVAAAEEPMAVDALTAAVTAELAEFQRRRSDFDKFVQSLQTQSNEEEERMDE